MNVAPSSRSDASLPTLYRQFAEQLRQQGFNGEIEHSDATLTVLSTDNSIYQRVPQIALFPRHRDDVALVTRLAGEPDFTRIVLGPRGGGTGTNGQSLTDGVVVDVSRHMNAIIDIDVEQRQVRVQPGVVKDQLNAALKPHGLFFAPELSTSNRATIGGMINTDASGQGSCEYGKTRDHVISVDALLIGGESLHAGHLKDSDVEQLIAAGGRVGDLVATARAVIDDHGAAIAERFPPLNRCLTGYDLAHLRDEQQRLDMRSLFCGSEGSLGLIVEATLNVLPLPRYSALVNIRYAGFMDALRDASALMHGATRPTSIETVDSKVLGLAMDDMVWDQVAEYFPAGSTPTAGINLVEFNADSNAALQQKIADFTQHLASDTAVERLGHTIAWGRAEMTAIYAMRKRSVGLLGNVEGEQRPIPFVEDTAVPPERLADYIAEFRALLDSHGLAYGMFGHVDAGVLHVRPAIDMKDPAQAALIRTISDGVAELTQRYGGLLWGEHGKGVRSEYSPAFFGPLYPLLQRIKGACDPHNQLNPGKIATPPDDSGASSSTSAWQLLKIDEVPTRGERDRLLDSAVWQHYGAAMHCNGNGACYNYDPNDAMCPSWKGTRDRIHSPKGRATLFKEWLLREQQSGADTTAAGLSRWQPLTQFPKRALATWQARRQGDDFSHQVYSAMAGCLACKSCAGQCPVKVNVPDFRSEFLTLYHSRYLRAPRDHLVASLERAMPLVAPLALAYNSLSQWRPVARFSERYIGLVDMPRLTRAPLAKQLRSWGIEYASRERLSVLNEEQKARSVVIVQDTFTTFFDTAVVRDIIELLQRLGVTVFVAPYGANGKPMQVHGFSAAFKRTAQRQSERLNALAACGVALVGIDPAMTLTYRQEYAKVLGADHAPQVALLQEWLTRYCAQHVTPLDTTILPPRYRLLGHCTEKTTAPGSQAAWQKLFAAFGLTLEIEGTGCCGMSGTYGHETRNKETSRTIYGLSWQPRVEQQQEGEVLLATGYSCRSQTKRFSSVQLKHPLQGLLQAIKIADLPSTTADESKRLTSA
ncbi:D-2-hydroxyglutarate dehydrogenase YdiJ [Carnimonas nigrificans]|uniref:D-2-hydroxyglutarate dehydrogenase YdiJ n=1 Tax=Carnimonas nigrificans TaxID=64323 RepID=UPI000470CC82|nr:FAD-binding and (Fe-S)-binding domain-containing protein [Carnimonas nigrificans]